MLNSIVRGKQQTVKATKGGFVAKNGQFLKRFCSKLDKSPPPAENVRHAGLVRAPFPAFGWPGNAPRPESRLANAIQAKPFAGLEIGVISLNCEVERSG
ncbi:hypothetical protein [Ralstonia sp. AU12-08]|uniref:hypothetical protein n=1 Tax=Ralstonia sp. AU12-08 TaxID=1235457 RepID=UPI001268A2FE|nr:hypothetical protein [Ralstonia sp. AU12-08]